MALLSLSLTACISPLGGSFKDDSKEQQRLGNPLDFVLKRRLKHPESERGFPAEVFLAR